jgi:sec-independent protein translocase protein TatC
MSTVSLPFLGERKEKPSPDNMTLNQHLGELRSRLIICVVAFALAVIVAVIAYEPILHFLIRPLCQANAAKGHGATTSGGALVHANATSCANLFVTSPLDGLSLRVKIAVFGGLILASPVILFQLWRFVTPGLQARERKYAVPFVSAAFVLFVAGAATAYFTLSHALAFLRAVGGPDLQQIYDPIPYLGLVMALMALFGITFQFPVILVSLELAHVVSPARLLHSWRWAVIGITVVSAVFTPSSDPFSMFALAIPLIVFYFLSIGIGKLLGR